MRYSCGSAEQENSVVLDGGVNKAGRVGQWASPHRRIFFATPQTFKNDVFTGARACAKDCNSESCITP